MVQVFSMPIEYSKVPRQTSTQVPIAVKPPMEVRKGSLESNAFSSSCESDHVIVYERQNSATLAKRAGRLNKTLEIFDAHPLESKIGRKRSVREQFGEECDDEGCCQEPSTSLQVVPATPAKKNSFNSFIEEQQVHYPTIVDSFHRFILTIHIFCRRSALLTRSKQSPAVPMRSLPS